MLSIENRYAIDPETARRFDTDALRKNFHVGGIFADGEIKLIYTHYDRMIVGGAVPAGGELVLDEVKPCGTASILDRREMVVVNIGAEGTVTAGESHKMAKGDMLYLGRGCGPVTFSGNGRFYLLSAPAHKELPSRLVKIDEAARIDLGSQETSNERTIHQFIHPDVMETCQLVVGMTKLHNGSVWNTMPAHVHDRRMEAYLYIDLPEDQMAVHLMGEPTETRHLIVRNEEGAISPPWSIHSGAGSASYAFIWAMAGDNVNYKDVEMVGMGEIR